jgi:UDP-glucuronate 4-epimerase
VRVLDRPPGAHPATGAPYAIYNIGNHEAVELAEFIATLERLLGRTAKRDLQPMQPGDVPATYASIDALRAATGFAPRTPLAEGLARFVAWYRDYHRA